MKNRGFLMITSIIIIIFLLAGCEPLPIGASSQSEEQICPTAETCPTQQPCPTQALPAAKTCPPAEPCPTAEPLPTAEPVPP